MDDAMITKITKILCNPTKEDLENVLPELNKFSDEEMAEFWRVLNRHNKSISEELYKKYPEFADRVLYSLTDLPKEKVAKEKAGILTNEISKRFRLEGYKREVKELQEKIEVLEAELASSEK